jgi:hypothetical protein
MRNRLAVRVAGERGLLLRRRLPQMGQERRRPRRRLMRTTGRRMSSLRLKRAAGARQLRLMVLEMRRPSRPGR